MIGVGVGYHDVFHVEHRQSRPSKGLATRRPAIDKEMVRIFYDQYVRLIVLFGERATAAEKVHPQLSVVLERERPVYDSHYFDKPIAI